MSSGVSKFYREGEKTAFSVYFSEDLAIRSPIFMNIPEPDIEMLIRPLGTYSVYIGTTEIGKRPWYWDPAVIQNPLIAIIGMPGAGKSLPPSEKVLVIRDDTPMIVSIKDVKVGDKVFAIDEDLRVRLSNVINVMKFHHRGKLLRITLRSGRTVVATPDHSFVVIKDGKLVPVKGSELKKGDMIPVLEKSLVDELLQTQDRTKLRKAFESSVLHDEVVNIEEIEYEGDVYDIETAENTFMTANGIFVHNSETVKTLIIRMKEKGIDIPVIIVDPEGEYHVIVKQLGEGVVLNIGTEHYVNIFDRPRWDFNYQLWVRKAVIPGILKALKISIRQAPLMMRVLEKAIFDVYEKIYRFDPVNKETWKKPDPTLLDVVRYLEGQVKPYLEGREKKQPPLFRTIMTLLERLRRWVEGQGTDFFAHSSTIQLSDLLKQSIVVFNVKSLPEDARDMFTYYIFSYFYALMEMMPPLPQFGLRIMLVFDEGWILLKHERGEESPLAPLFRRARKYGFASIIATQQYKDVSADILPLVGSVILLRIRDADAVKKLKETLKIPDRIAELIPNLPTGKAVVSIAWRRTDFQNANVPFIVDVETAVKPVLTMVFYKYIGPEDMFRALKAQMARSGE